MSNTLGVDDYVIEWDGKKINVGFLVDGKWYNGVLE